MERHSFLKKLEFSHGANAEDDKAKIKCALGAACIGVEKTDVETDKTGIDYIATLKKGATIYIDAKRRESGASRWWKHGCPELAIETWSVYNKKFGWTFNQSSNVDYILYTFNPLDSDRYYFIPFQLLRKVSFDNGMKWMKLYGEKKQPNYGWESRAIFVPADVLIEAISKEMSKAV